ncbi:MAG TPA: hypothetical protein VKF62_04305 [Planctomycetota bacterium]|nr:hypothetical protein [Planctomycetota bacterium]
MSNARSFRSFLPAVPFLLISGSLGLAQEHPEHPKDAGKKKAAAAVTKEDLGDAITEYVKKDAQLKGGYFLVYDASAKKALALTLDKVHKDKLARVGENTYFACADFKTPEGTTYDLDVFMKGASKDQLTVTEVSVHKEDGKERYTWSEKDGTWSKKPVGSDKG